MKKFLSILAIWVVLMLFFTFLFAAFLFDSQHIYRTSLVVSIVMSIITYLFEQQSDRIDVLEKRIKDLGGNK